MRYLIPLLDASTSIQLKDLFVKNDIYSIKFIQCSLKAFSDKHYVGFSCSYNDEPDDRSMVTPVITTITDENEETSISISPSSRFVSFVVLLPRDDSTIISPILTETNTHYILNSTENIRSISIDVYIDGKPVVDELKNQPIFIIIEC
jgi:hypothetical protein